MGSIKVGFMGLGTMGFPMCYNLHKAGYQINLPGYRQEEDCKSGYSDLVCDFDTKMATIDQMITDGAQKCSSQKELIQNSDVIMISMPNSKFVEGLMYGEEGIIENARKGTIVIDLTSADPMSTQKLNKELEKKEVELIDAPVSGGAVGSINHTLSIMVGGKKEIFEKVLPILGTIGNPDKIQYVGPSGAGHVLKVANNFLSACCTAATTEALAVCAKAGIDPQTACQVIAGSGGRSDASMNKYPNYVFAGKDFHFTMNLMTKDIGLFVSAAKDLHVPAFIANQTNQVWNIPVAEGKGNEDCMSVVKMFENWCGIQLVDIKDKTEE